MIEEWANMPGIPPKEEKAENFEKRGVSNSKPNIRMIIPTKSDKIDLFAYDDCKNSKKG